MTFPGNTYYDATVFEEIENGHGLEFSRAEVEYKLPETHFIIQIKPLLPSSGMLWLVDSVSFSHFFVPHLMECHLGL